MPQPTSLYAAIFNPSPTQLTTRTRPTHPARPQHHTPHTMALKRINKELTDLGRYVFSLALKAAALA